MSKEFAIADEVWHRVVQIVQEAMITGVDCADIMRQVRVKVGDNGDLVLTEAYKQMVNDNYDRMLRDAEEMQRARVGINIITSENDVKKDN